MDEETVKTESVEESSPQAETAGVPASDSPAEEAVIQTETPSETPSEIVESVGVVEETPEVLQTETTNPVEPAVMPEPDTETPGQTTSQNAEKPAIVEQVKNAPEARSLETSGTTATPPENIQNPTPAENIPAEEAVEEVAPAEQAREEAPSTPQTSEAQVEPPAPEPEPISPKAENLQTLEPKQTGVESTPKSEQSISPEPNKNIVLALLLKARAEIQRRKQEKLQKIMALLDSKPTITNEDVRTSLRTSRVSAFRYLNTLEKQGRIMQQGKTGKSVFYAKIQ